MDYQHIAAAAGAEAAQKIENDCESFVYKKIDPETLDDLTRGAAILGTETIDYPLTDGIIIYIKQPAGAVIGLIFETDTDTEGLYDLISTKKAIIQEGGA